MIIEYAPEGGERRRWDLNAVKLMASEAETLERLTGWTWHEAKQQLSKGSMRALRSFAYVLEKRANPSLRYSQFEPAADELDYWLDDVERKAWREELETAPDLDDEQREEMLAALDELDAVIAAKDDDAGQSEPGEELPKD